MLFSHRVENSPPPKRSPVHESGATPVVHDGASPGGATPAQCDHRFRSVYRTHQQDSATFRAWDRVIFGRMIACEGSSSVGSESTSYPNSRGTLAGKAAILKSGYLESTDSAVVSSAMCTESSPVIPSRNAPDEGRDPPSTI